LDYWHAEMAESPEWQLVLGSGDFRRASEGGRGAGGLGLGGVMPIDDDLGLLRRFHRLGIRSIGLTWNGRNLLGDGVSVGARGGLTGYGRDAVREMKRGGSGGVVSHMGDRR